jgi:hypothetical protein
MITDESEQKSKEGSDEKRAQSPARAHTEQLKVLSDLLHVVHSAF